MIRGRAFLRCLFPILTSVCAGAFAADDDVEIEEVSASSAEIEIRRPRIVRLAPVVRRLTKEESDAQQVAQFERAIFMKDYTAQRGRWTINSELDCVINRLDGLCQLTDSQKQKLQLAGRADRKHFFDRVDAARVTSREGNTVESQAEIQMLQVKTVTGILGSDSFFAKSVRMTLTDEQLGKLDECRRSNRAASIERTLGDVERIVKLEQSQRDAFIQLLLEEVPYPPDFENFGLLMGNSERMAMMYHLSQIADEKIKSFLDPVQWETLKPHLREFRTFKLYLIQRGLIASNANATAAMNPAQPPKEQK